MLSVFLDFLLANGHSVLVAFAHVDVYVCVCMSLYICSLYIIQIVGSENPLLMAAAEQIFSAGGKRMRPALVLLASKATAELAGLK